MQQVIAPKSEGPRSAHKIAILIPYFGTVPWYFKFFNKSCTYNPDVDFILLTDMELPAGLAKNIIVVNCSLQEISKRYSSVLGFEIDIVRPYKLCDLRPAFGLVFSELIQDYDFWGYGDIDVVLGNVRSLITAEILNKNDVVTIKKDYIGGFFTLFRNNDKLNNIFRQSKDYKKVFQEPVDYCFDECNWEWGALHNGKDILELNSVIDSITHVVKRAERAGEITVFWQSMEVHPGRVLWDHGNLICSHNKTPLLCHFNFFKDYEFKYVPKWKTIPDRFYMNSFYFTRFAPTSLPGIALHCSLVTARLLKRSVSKLRHYIQWGRSYLFASRKIDQKDMQHFSALPGAYRFQQVVVNVFIKDECLHGNVDGYHFRLLHKGAGKFVVAKCWFLELLNVELDFRFNEFISSYFIQATCFGLSKKYTFFKIS